MGLFFGLILWQMSAPTTQLESLSREIQSLDLRVHVLESDGGEAAFDNPAKHSQPPTAPKGLPFVQETLKESPSDSSVLHSMVLQKSASVRNLANMAMECQKAMALDPKDMNDPFGPPLWKKVLIEHRRSSFGDCRNGRGCHGFVSQGYQDVFLYSALWRHLDRPGVYVDLAANDWQYISNTLFADHCLKWDGICIEANPYYYGGLDGKRRCVVEKTCVAEKEKQVNFNMQGVFGGILGDMKDDDARGRTGRGHGKVRTMTCQSLSQILKRYDVRHVDYMNLDVEGVELQCLQGTDWDAVTIDVIGIEHNQKFEALQEFLVSHGYIETVTVAHDVMFVHKSATNVLEVLSRWRRDDCPRINAELKIINNGKNIVPRC